MATTSRQSAIFGIQDWKRFFKTYKEADFQSYNFETLRKTFIDYLRQQHPESFNDYVESSEYIALLNVIAFMGQSLAFRNDLNTRENFIDTAERRDSVTKLSELISYSAKRNGTATGYLKIVSLSTTENLIDYNRNSLSNVIIRWNDKTNSDWQEQFTTVLNAALVSSQKIGAPGNTNNILGIKTDEYSLNITDGTLPVIPFSAIVDEVSMNFEIVNGTSINEEFIYEPAPKLNGALNVLYRNDNQGFGGINTGYFFFFKQGALQVQDFTLSERIENRSIAGNIFGVNNTDVWLYKINQDTSAVGDLWKPVENIYASENNQIAAEDRDFFSISSHARDRISFNFGDGVFSTIPVGDFRSYMRESNGLEYTINPEEIQNLDVSFSYLSRVGRLETMTITLGLTTPVSNAIGSENNDDIKRRAPARFYTQNRMVNGEDYTNFPYTTNSSIIKSKSLVRTNIGASRYLDLIDPTGKYSSINAYGSDGIIYENSPINTFDFTFINKNDIDSVIRNQIEPILASRGMAHYYYANFPRIDMDSGDGILWGQSTTVTNATTGYFKTPDFGVPIAIGPNYAGKVKYLTENALVKFAAPPGQFFNANNRLMSGISSSDDDKLFIWSTILDVILDGTGNGQAHVTPGPGPVSLNNFIPSDAFPVQIIPFFNSNLPQEIEIAMRDQIELFRSFGLEFDNLINEWSIILDISLLASDGNWLVKFVPDSTLGYYTVSSRSLNYFFSSVLETRFYFDGQKDIYDPRTGKVVNDFIRVLSSNPQPGPINVPLVGDVTMDIIGQDVEPDGFVNDYFVEVSFTDSDRDGIADDPDFFVTLVAAESNVYLRLEIDFDNLERYLPVEDGVVNEEYQTQDEILAVKTQYPAGQIFYASADDLFYELVISSEERDVILSDRMKLEHGRGALHFQYKHNSPETTRINPSVTNIIDTYLVVSNYYDEYLNYITDSTNTITEPVKPSTDDLTVQYNNLQTKRMTSDNMVLNSVRFKPLFGPKAAKNLQAFIKVVKLNNTTTSNSEIKSQVISKINTYFDINNWDFGDTFYFTELSAFLHAELGDVLGSVVIIPKDADAKFGELFEINSAPYEIFISAATVNDIEIIDSLTQSNLNNKGIINT